MNYVSTRGGPCKPGGGDAAFLDILLEGLASDGGLAMPETYPRIAPDLLDAWRFLSYPELAFEIVRLFATDIPAGDLRAIVAKTYTRDAFGDAAITPLASLDAYRPGLTLLQLSNGPTLAFKDLAMQLLGNLFEYALARTGRSLNVVGATSGDTGSAAEYALRGKANVRVFMLSPRGRMSPFQTAQMFSLPDANIHNLAIDGVFDDCQDIVKAISGDAAFKARHAIGTVNSINWARVVAQVVYYFRGYFLATASNDERVSFTVPSGNFGNICAGHIARIDGPADRPAGLRDERQRRARRVLPHRRLSRADRRRDARDQQPEHGHQQGVELRALRVRPRRPRPGRAARVVAAGRDRRPLRPVVVAGLRRRRGTRTASRPARATHAEMIATIRGVHDATGRIVDPHTAVAVKVARERMRDGETMIALETAQPAKFAETIREALGIEPPVPTGYEDLLERPQRSVELPADVDAVRAFIERHGG